jgi:Zn ribbon nucleic-acid-binding protein
MGLSDYFKRKEKDVMCPECEKHRKHVKLVEANGKVLECPECHYQHIMHR